MSSKSYLYRPQIYLTALHREHVSFLREGYTEYLTIPNHQNTLYYPAKLSLRAQNSVINELNGKHNKSKIQYLFLLVSLKLAGKSFHAQLSEFKRNYPGINHSQEIDRYVEYFSKIKTPVAASTNKQSIRWQYQKLLGKANSEGYFTIPNVPVFLVSTKWLEQLYSSSETSPTPINNQQLVETVNFPLALHKYLPYNYTIKQDLRQNEDYKLVSYQAWQLLYQTYKGFQIKRFTTSQSQPIVEIWYIKISILIVEERCVFHNLQLQVSKGQSFKQLLQRIRVTLLRYKIVPQKYLSRQMSLIKSRQISVDQIIAIIQDDSQPCIINHHFEKIFDLSLLIQEAQIMTSHDILILNLGPSQKSIYSKLSQIKILNSRQRCQNCGINDKLFACECGSVFFCSKTCKQNKKIHKKDCNLLVAQTRKYNLVTEYYQVKRRCFSDIKKIHEIGKVGFENLGNTCYMNAALQCLIRLPNLVEYFLSNGHLKDLNVSNVLGSEGHIACAFGQLIKSYYTTNKRSLQPVDILKCIAKNPQFRGYNHQDSQQFLNYFLDKMHQDLNKIKVKPSTESIESDGRPDQIVSKISWQIHKKRNDSFVSDLLAGQYRSQIRCPDCNRVSITFDPFLSITLQFPRPQKGEMVEGYFMTDQGQFQKVDVEVKSSMPTYEFYEKYFQQPVIGVYLREKKIGQFWDENKTVFQNKKSTGLLFFFQQPHDHIIQIITEIYNYNKENLENFTRIIYAKQLNSQQQLIKKILLSIRRPLQKAMSKDFNQQEFLNACLLKKVIKIKLIDENGLQPEFPILGNRKLKIKAEINHQIITISTPKLNVASGSYTGKAESLVKKLKGQISVQELLQCFCQPQRLTNQNAWYCSVCKDHKLAEKAMSLYTLPQYLIVHLKRFNHRGDSGNRYIIYGEKVTTPIALLEYEVINGKRYQLIGIVNHTGSLTHGHYTACVKRDEWFVYDDSRCYRDKLNGKNAYLLFYKQVQ